MEHKKSAIEKKLPQKIRKILEKFKLSVSDVLEKGVNGLLQLVGSRYALLIFLAVVGAGIKKVSSQTDPNRPLNTVRFQNFHYVIDNSVYVLGADDYEEKFNEQMGHIKTEDYRIEDMYIVPRADVEYTSDITGSGYPGTDAINFGYWVRDAVNNCNTNDFHIFQTNVPGYEAFTPTEGPDPDGWVITVSSGGYDQPIMTAHEVWGHGTAALDGAHQQARTNMTYLFNPGSSWITNSDGKTKGATNIGGFYLSTFTVPLAYNKNSVANGGDGYFHSIYSETQPFPLKVPVNQMHNNTGYTNVTQGIWQFYQDYPQFLREEATAPPAMPVEDSNPYDNNIGLGNIADFDKYFPNTTDVNFQDVYNTPENYELYLYNADDAVDNHQIAGPIAPNQSFANLTNGDYKIAVYAKVGNGLTFSNDITVFIDNEPPTIVTQDTDAYLDESGQASIIPEGVDGGSYDNVGITGMTVNPNTFDCDDLGANTVTLTACDAAENCASGTATLTVHDTISPDANTQNITAYLDENGNLNVDPNQVNNNSTDNCSIASMTVDPANFSCSDVGVQPVTFTVTDPSGNSNSEPATVTVEDNLGPNINIQDITIQLDADGNASATAEDLDVGTTDNCQLDEISISQENFTCSDLGDNTVTFTATDIYGNTSTENATVTVTDNVDPVAVGQNVTAYLDEDGEAVVNPNAVDDGSYDNCSIETMTVNPANFSCSDMVVQTLTFTVTDPSGNDDSQEITVSVVDEIAPTAIGQDITIDLAVSNPFVITAGDVDGGSFDNCTLSGLTIDQDTFTQIGNYAVELTVTDDSENTGSTTVNVEVVLSNGFKETTSIKELKIYPNPIKNIVNIEAGESIKGIILTSMAGKTLIKKHFSNNSKPESSRISVDMSNISQGMYILKIIGDIGNSSFIQINKI